MITFIIENIAQLEIQTPEHIARERERARDALKDHKTLKKQSKDCQPARIQPERKSEREQARQKILELMSLKPYGLNDEALYELMVPIRAEKADWVARKASESLNLQKSNACALDETLWRALRARERLQKAICLSISEY